jgi:hypothetical protein
MMNKITLPEFDRNKKIEKQGAFVFDGPCNHDFILGCDFLLHFATDQVDESREGNEEQNSHQYGREVNPAGIADDEFENYVGQILESKYDKVSPAEVAEAQKHLTSEQRKGIKSFCVKVSSTFRGELGVYPGRKIHLKVEPGVIPVPARPYSSAARLHLEVFKQELKRLVKIGVLRPCGATNWASHTFVIPKKD